MTIPRLRRSGSRLFFHARFTDGVVDALTGQAATFARAGDAYALGSNGVYSRVPHSRARFEVESGVPGLLLEASQENLLLQSADIDTGDAAWSIGSQLNYGAAQTSVVPGQVAHSYVYKASPSGASTVFQTVGTVTANPHTLVCVIESGDALTTRIDIFDQTNAESLFIADYTWATDSIALTGGGTGTSKSVYSKRLAEAGPNGNPVVLIVGTATPTTTGGTRLWRVFPAHTPVTEGVGGVLHYGALTETSYPTAPIVTGASAVTRATEALYYAWNVGAVKPWSAYVKFVAPPAGSPALLRISGSAPDILVDISSGEIRVVHDNNSSTVSSTTSGVSMSQGDVVEARVRFGSDGKVTAAASVNEGTEVVGTQSSALSIASWGSARIYPGGLAAEQSRVGIREVKVHPDPDLTVAQLRSA